MIPSIDIGTVLSNRYRVDGALGQGGMAEVYKVWDEKRSSFLAMKVLRDDLAEDKVFLRRFRREAQNLAKLQHPGIVRFYGLEQDGDRVYMLMDYVEGTTLRKEIFRSDDPLSPTRILEIFRPLCSALHYAHQLGIIHCDVKPANIMIDLSSRVLLTDFGIARMSDAATATMVGAGTPAYMAPEQVRGEDPTPRTDIYALGAVLFEMLTGGERPFTGERTTISGTTGEKVRWEHAHLNPPSLTRFNWPVTEDVDDIVRRSLALAPDQRWENCQELLHALEEALPAQAGLDQQTAAVQEATPAEEDPEIERVANDQAAVRDVPNLTDAHESGDYDSAQPFIIIGIICLVLSILLVLFSGIL